MNKLREDMSTIQVRLIMKEKGWISKDEITTTGWGKDKNGKDKFGFSIWFERWDWHGVSCGKICIHSHTSNLKQINKITYKVAKKALKAWENFKNSVPCQLADGSLQDDSIQTNFFKKEKTRAKIYKKYIKKDREELFDKLIARVEKK